MTAGTRLLRVAGMGSAITLRNQCEPGEPPEATARIHQAGTKLRRTFHAI